MLSMFGLLKKNLELQGKLPNKWKGSVGEAYDADYNLVDSQELTSNYFFYPPEKVSPILYDHKVMVEAKFDTSKFKSTDVVCAQTAFSGRARSNIYSVLQLTPYSGKYRLHTGLNSKIVKNYGGPFTYFVLDNPYFYLRLIHDTLKDYAYYSIDGSTWTLFDHWSSLPSEEFLDICVRSDSFAVKQEDIKITIDDELVFGLID